MHVSNLIKGLLTDELIVFQDMLCFSCHDSFRVALYR